MIALFWTVVIAVPIFVCGYYLGYGNGVRWCNTLWESKRNAPQ